MDTKTLESVVNRIVARILEVAKPTKIILFGSAARGKMTENSDLDLLVVVPAGVHRRRTAQKIYRNLIGVGFAADIIVVTEDDVERFRGHQGMIIMPAMEEGKTLYAAA
jgi:predicted nucleotidyltransferase